MDARVLRSWWAHRQGLIGTWSATPSQVLERAGWARSVGGVNPYLTLHSRASITRAEADQAVATLQIHELPSARGCTYVVPASDFAVALRVGQGLGESQDLRVAKTHLGVTDDELDRLCQAVLAALERGAADPAGLREQLGDAVRNLGEAGKKRGMTTTLPLALGRLQSQGRIRRQPHNGRLDQQRYAYVLWPDNPLEREKLSYDEALLRMAERYFRWIGPATVSEFQWFSGLTARDAKAVLARLPLVERSGWLAFPEDWDALDRWSEPVEPDYRLVNALDSLFLARRDVRSFLEESDHGRSGYGERGAVPLGDQQDLPNNAIVDRGRIVGLWEYDPEAGEIVACCFIQSNAVLREAIARTERMIRDELGDARTFSLDSPKSRAPKLAGLRAAGG